MNLRLYILPLLAFSLVTPTISHAKDIQYFSTEDVSIREVLLRERGLEDSTYHRCQLATLQCVKVSDDTTLIPKSLESAVHYYLSPRNDWAVVTAFRPGSTPLHMLYAVSGETLTEKGAIPLSMDITRVRFSEDGSVLLITQADGSVVRYETATKKVSPVTSMPSGASWLTLSPNGRYLAFYIPATQSRGMRTFGVVDTIANTVSTYDEQNSYWDLLTEGTTLFAFSPDSSKLLYLSDREGYPTLYQVPLQTLSTTGMAGTRLITQNYSVTDFIWKDAATIILAANRDNAYAYNLYAYTPASGAMVELAKDVSYDSAMIRSGSQVIFNRIQGPARVPAVLDLSTNTIRSFSISGYTASSNKPGEIVTPGELSGVWMKPTKDTKTLVVWLHGGPYRQVSTVYHSYFGYAGYDWLLDAVRDAGAAVLKLDYPGSQGFGRSFAESITGQVGNGDVSASLEAVQEFAKEKGYTDIYLLGNSYGGYLALKMLVDHPSEFKGAFSINGVTDWEVLTTNLRTSIFNVQFGGLKNASNAALYEKASIIEGIEKLKKQKVVLAHGNTDMTVPYAQSRLLADELKDARKNVTFVTYKGEDHVFTKEKTFIDLCKRVMKFAGVSGTCKI